MSYGLSLDKLQEPGLGSKVKCFLPKGPEFSIASQYVTSRCSVQMVCKLRERIQPKPGSQKPTLKMIDDPHGMESRAMCCAVHVFLRLLPWKCWMVLKSRKGVKG